MNKDKIKEKFEKISKASPRFSEWVVWKQCSQEEMNLFTKWLNQLSEEELCEYLEKDGSILSVIKNQTGSMCKSSIKNASQYLKYVKEQTVDLCLLALENSSPSYIYVRIVPNPTFPTTMTNLKAKKAILEALK